MVVFYLTVPICEKSQRGGKPMAIPRLNGVILSSIPLNRKMKRYWISKYERIAENCGVEEAQRKFKNLRVTLLKYLADTNRKSNLDVHLKNSGFRCNGYLRMLFEYADTQPHFVLSFLKLYSSTQESSMTTDEAATAVNQRLKQVKAQQQVPVYLTLWVNIACMPYHGRHDHYLAAKRNMKHCFHAFASRVTPRQWHAYWNRWHHRLQKGWKSHASCDYKLVFPEVYKDFKTDGSSDSYLEDLASLLGMEMYADTDPDWAPLSRDQLDFVHEYLNDEVADLFQRVVAGEISYPEIFGKQSFLSGLSVGHVQHIHKKGGGTELRDIAVPNRFIQLALIPGAARLYHVLRQLPNDATFDQDKFDTYITNRVTNDNLYIGSVDLSKATDNLPLSWGVEIVNSLRHYFGEEGRHLGDEQIRSIELFYTVARAKWEDEGYLMEWDVGQPLGSVTSFAMLGLTHNILLESISLTCGISHSPYRVLGDDVVIGNKKVRKRYIAELRSRAVPLSLHKSYDGRLTEFAGKTYVKNNIPFYTSDHNTITWQALFDWQRTTGIRIAWENLPRAIKSKIASIARSQLVEKGITNPHHDAVVRLAYSSYRLALTCEVPGRGSLLYPLDMSSMSDLIVRYFEYRITDSPVPEAVKHTGITTLRDGSPVMLMHERFAEKDGYFLRFRPVELPAWYKDKVRPCATDSVIHAATAACSENT
jgi:hypothetical protein